MAPKRKISYIYSRQSRTIIAKENSFTYIHLQLPVAYRTPVCIAKSRNCANIESMDFSYIYTVL